MNVNQKVGFNLTSCTNCRGKDSRSRCKGSGEIILVGGLMPNKTCCKCGGSGRWPSCGGSGR